MKLFIGWSGERSKGVATELRRWIPKVIQAVSPWMSETDIHAGDRWLAELSRQLEETSFGIVVLTSENTAAPWINFEAGALAKKLNESAVCPYLLDIAEQTELTGPLAQFQSKQANKKDTLALLNDVNATLGESRLGESVLTETFERWWPDLDRVIQFKPPSQAKPSKRSDRELIEEVLERVRSLGREFVRPSIFASHRDSDHSLILRTLLDLEFLKSASSKNPLGRTNSLKELEATLEKISLEAEKKNSESEGGEGEK